ncbi:MAG: hypothetical protein RIR52_339 [Acidobacteriota bacterium]
MKTIVIGVGNLHRGDDAVGLVVASRLAAKLVRGEPLPARIVEASGEGASLIDAWQGYERAILIDAVRPGSALGPPGSIYRIDVHSTELPSGLFHYSTHAFSVAEAVEMARVLGLLPGVMLVWGVVGQSFAPGSGLSGAVESAAERLTADLITMLDSEPQ